LNKATDAVVTGRSELKFFDAPKTLNPEQLMNLLLSSAINKIIVTGLSDAGFNESEF